MKTMRILRLFFFLATLFAAYCPTASAQYVVGVSAILTSTSSSQIDTYSATELDYTADMYYDPAVEGYLFQDSSQIRWGYVAAGSGSNTAYGYFNAPVSVGSDYQLESDHYVLAAYMVEVGGYYYYSNPYAFSIAPGGGGSGPGSSSFEPGGGDYYIETETIYLGTTAVGISTAPPYIGGIREWATGGTSGLRGTSGYIEVYGSHLLDVFDGGTTPAISGSGVTVDVYWASAVQVNLSYTIASTASTGPRTLTLSTRFGESNGATFSVYDPSPSISGISPDPMEAGGVAAFTVSGSGFGSNPTISVAGSGVGTSGIYSGSDTLISAWVDLTYAPAGDITVTVNASGIGGLPFAPAPQGGTGQASRNASVTVRPTVSISSVSIPEDKITVSLGPTAASGTLSVQATGSTTHTILQENRQGGSHQVSFNVPTLPDGQEFHQIVVTWTVGGQTATASAAYHFKVLGNYLNTRYNTPTESYCSGNMIDLWWVQGSQINPCSQVDNCTFTQYQGKQGWWSEVYENGSGVSDTQGAISREWYCSGRDRPTRRVSAPCPQCSAQTLAVGATVARRVSNDDLPCGARLYVHQVGTVTVTDAGGGLASNQLDHYAGYGGCNRDAGTIGYRKVIRLF